MQLLQLKNNDTSYFKSLEEYIHNIYIYTIKNLKNINTL